MEEEVKPEALQGRGGCWFRKDEAVVHIGVEEPFAPQRKAHPAFVIADLDTQKGEPSEHEALRVAGNFVTPDGELAPPEMVAALREKGVEVIKASER